MFAIDPALLGLEDAVALVTGGGLGIAKGCALRLAQAGCHVAIADLNPEVGGATVREIEKLGRRSVFIQADVREEASAREMVARTLAVLGSLDVACNVVGNLSHGPKPFLDLSLEEWNATVHRNLGT